MLAKKERRFKNLCEIEKIVAFHLTGKGTFVDGQLVAVAEYPKNNAVMDTVLELIAESK